MNEMMKRVFSNHGSTFCQINSTYVYFSSTQIKVKCNGTIDYIKENNSGQDDVFNDDVESSGFGKVFVLKDPGPCGPGSDWPPSG